MALTSDGMRIVTGQALDYGDPRALAAIDCDQEADRHNLADRQQFLCQQPLGVRRYLRLCLSNIKRRNALNKRRSTRRHVDKSAC
jgi:hypothetical protein